MTSEPSVVSAEEINAFLAKGFESGSLPDVKLAERDRVILRLDCGAEHLRPGGFVSGPTQMTMADTAAYVAVFTRMGLTPMALTSNLNINFLRPCQSTWLEAECRVLKFGRASVVSEVNLRGEASDKAVSHATVTYVLPR
ncbi:PaaI family thioesterase [Parvularcula lutaonensis]|uniref:PaaI family thioesterase n=1 Tax=Parvularcula lutaonensis TaxID=491923 RepID=A0ABV7MAE1_9PROT|nr:PaaI family thioesterase [Parvularcula lutaonensis]GGY36764.1 thioesterase [Parvularcula lutaonensis]